MLSMSAGEVIASLAAAFAVARSLGVRLQAVIVVGDCRPAARAFCMLYSRSAQIRSLLGACRSIAPRWLGGTKS